MQSLHCIGFRTVVQRNSVKNDAFDTFINIQMLTDKDIATMATDYSSRAATGRIVFGTRRTKLLKAYVLWIQDFYRTSNVPIIVGLNEATFKLQLQ